MKNYRIINGEHLKSNIQNYNSKKICAMVKSNAYGHGLNEIVKIAEPLVEYFGVVSLEEALAVRKISEKPILICSKVFDYKACKKNNIDVMIDNEQDLLLAIRCKNTIHLKIDCGMNRYGIRSKFEIFQINKLLEQSEANIKYIYTHFCDTKNKSCTKKDYANFLKLKSKLIKDVPICMGGSGVFDYGFEYDMLRLGLAMYGYGKNVLPVERLVSHVCKVFFAKKGETIGYNGAYHVRHDGFFAIIPVGYGDGLRRNLSNNFFVEINGKKFKSVGNICMDVFFVKVDQSVMVGDEVIVMQNAFDLSKGTIPYEVLTSFSSFRGETIIK